MRSQVHEERDFAVPAEKHPQLLIDAESPILGELAPELVNPKERVFGVSGEASESCSKHPGFGVLELHRLSQKPPGCDESHQPFSSSMRASTSSKADASPAWYSASASRTSDAAGRAAATGRRAPRPPRALALCRGSGRAAGQARSARQGDPRLRGRDEGKAGGDDSRRGDPVGRIPAF